MLEEFRVYPQPMGWGLRTAIIVTVAVGLQACSSDAGIIDCPAYIDRQIECGIIPPQNADAVRDTNIRICNNWENTYKVPVMEALAACIDVDCSELQVCVSQANQLCQADVSSSIDTLCGKVVECGWEDLTTDELCQEELVRNSGLYMCLRPDVLDDYVNCVTSISCGPDSEDEWYVCGFELQSR